ncbi:ankyrin repeat domain-containing protein [Maribacter sp. 6B07]|uniref:Ankyrin repeat-containing protein n=1 Tax=Maribacter dokdonensis TaxID=320912 RepID=A0A1H4JDC4_9FLAO|nr:MULTISPECIES: ankyrin repeat domain-containing protein [Maribacter]APA66259.1 ankyrin [Maribacter sp. 1_2014MBL_MicDiv]PHN93203.1 ankyrin repeat domain-containing protein [Maribacter sp. 6B07]CAG2534012.1 Ankyrin repeat-containing protein [Maribacter dokdonensis]SDR91062.1 Ankyrin repeat-containing protein [Maribacter dokdonensis]SEB44127.1 Ankyrin repeat-containing protein [Maribacter dokdonensis]
MKKVILTLSMVALTMGSTILAADKTSNATDSNTTLVKRVNISSFCKAVIKGDLETVKRLIDLGEDVNQKSLGMTPAMFAARYNKVDVLEILIDNGADLNLKSNQGYTAKRYAELSNATDALELIEIAAGS